LGVPSAFTRVPPWITAMRVTDPMPPAPSSRLDGQVLPNLSTVVRDGLCPRPDGADVHSPAIAPESTSMWTIVPRADAATLT
jgi:hypothetical protein